MRDQRLGAPARSFATADGSKVVEYIDSATERDFTGTQSATAQSCQPEEYQTSSTITRDTLFPNPTYNVRSTTTANQSCLNFNTGSQATYKNVERSCHVTFIVDKGGIVQSATSNGGLCYRM